MTTTFVNNDSDRLVFPARIYENSSSSCTMNSIDDDENNNNNNNNNDSQCAVETTNDCMLLYQSFHWKRVLSCFLLGSLLGASLEFLSFQAILHNSLEQQQQEEEEEETTTSKSHLIWFHTVVSMDIIVLYFVMAAYFMLLAYQVKNYHYACQQRISPKTCHFVTSLSVGMVNGICMGMALSMGHDHVMGWRFHMGFMGQTMMTFYCAFLLACHVQRHLSCSSSSSSEQQQAVVVRQGKNNHAPDELLERLL